MLTPSTPVATPVSLDSTPTAKAAAVEAHARADVRQQAQAGAVSDARQADLASTRRAAREAASEVPDPMTSLSTIAVAGAMSSVPAALEMMRSIALQSAAGSLSVTDRQTLHAEYAQLTAHVATTVGSVGAGEQAQTSTSDGQRQDDAADTRRDSGGGSTLTQAQAEAGQAVQHPPVEQAGAAQPQASTADGNGPQPAPRLDVRTHELHVGADSYEPVPVRQSFERPPEPAGGGGPETQHLPAIQAAQVTQFVQVAQPEHAAPVVAVA